MLHVSRWKNDVRDDDCIARDAEPMMRGVAFDGINERKKDGAAMKSYRTGSYVVLPVEHDVAIAISEMD